MSDFLAGFAAREMERIRRELWQAVRFGSAYGGTSTGLWSHELEASASDIAWALGAALGRTAAYNGVKYDEKPHEESLLPEQPPPPP